MNIIQNINLGRQQLALGFERPAYEKNLQKVLSVIDSKIAENDQVMFDEIAMHFSMAPYEWPEKHIHDLVLDLFKEDKIKKVLERKNASPLIRNKILFPLQAGKEKINAASNLKSIAEGLNNAIDQFEVAAELLD